MICPHRRHPLYIAYILHRVSGVFLTVFLLVHFYVLGLALNEIAQLDALLHWSDNPLVKLAETGLVFFLGIHFFGGLRILALEFLPWSPRQKTFVAAAIASAFIVSCGFLLNSF